MCLGNPVLYAAIDFPPWELCDHTPTKADLWFDAYLDEAAYDGEKVADDEEDVPAVDELHAVGPAHLAAQIVLEERHKLLKHVVQNKKHTDKDKGEWGRLALIGFLYSDTCYAEDRFLWVDHASGPITGNKEIKSGLIILRLKSSLVIRGWQRSLTDI